MVFLVLIMLPVLVSCKVSKDYQGEWFALDGLEKQVKLDFSEKELKISDGNRYSLSQYGIGVANSMHYFQIKIDDEKYSLIYPDKKDKDTALVVKPDDEDKPLEGKILFKMNRNKYPEAN
ncbi:hypothetical protein [Carnobacterium maltaromaticum]|uniref:hypothetical protein n=1 Tax=Carnobacterium maltaromaticum TaxID=2751 RepID=UPI002ADD7E0D|nr:hypothetical protein [Carnobacterium maltaromaticum]